MTTLVMLLPVTPMRTRSNFDCPDQPSQRPYNLRFRMLLNSNYASVPWNLRFKWHRPATPRALLEGGILVLLLVMTGDSVRGTLERPAALRQATHSILLVITEALELLKCVHRHMLEDPDSEARFRGSTLWSRAANVLIDGLPNDSAHFELRELLRNIVMYVGPIPWQCFCDRLIMTSSSVS